MGKDELRAPAESLPALAAPSILDMGLDVRWIDPDAQSGPVVQIGRDIMHRDPPGGRVVWNKAIHAPSERYAACAEQVLLAIAERWGAPLVMVQDFQIQPNLFTKNAVTLCRRLCRAGAVEQLIVLDKPWMPTPVMKGVMAALRATGLRVYLVNGDDGLGRYLDTIDPMILQLEQGRARMLEQRERLLLETREE